MALGNTILLVIGIILALEGAFFFLFKKGGKALLKAFAKMPTGKLRLMALIELIIG